MGKKSLLICIFLTAATGIAFWQVNHCDFLTYDDKTYVTENAPVLGGLTMEGIRWAFTTQYAEFWHPITWLSHMLDIQLFGLEPRGHHLTNLFFHLANTLLLFLIFSRMTKALWRSAMVAAWFALHPLHVESVAWVAERKEVLSTLFWILAMGAFVLYAERRGVARYLAVLLFFILGLMAKPMLVTLPFALLLLDYWPLQRLAFKELPRQGQGEDYNTRAVIKGRGKSRKQPAAGMAKKPGPLPVQKGIWASLWPLLREKIPLIALTAPAAVLAYLAQHKGGEIGFAEGFPPLDRVANAFLSYILYAKKTIWPQNLAAFYPFPEVLPLWKIWGSIFVLGVVTFLAIRAAKRFPYLIVGWLWYVGTLVPVIGIVQVGKHGLADRYTYIPLIGLFIMAAWGVPDLLQRWRYGKPALWAASGLSILILSMITWTQVGYWRSSVKLFEHAVEVTEPNWNSYVFRGTAYGDAGYYREASADMDRAIKLNPIYSPAYISRAGYQMKMGNHQQALADLNKAIDIYPTYAPAYNNRAVIQINLGNYRQAVEDSRKAIELDPKSAEAYCNRGNAYTRLGDPQLALQDFQKAIELSPKSAVAYANRAGVHERLGNYRQAIEDYDRALAIDPKYAEAYNNRGDAHASLGHSRQAIQDFSRAIELNPKYAVAYNNRAGVYGSLGSYRQAIDDSGKAIEINPAYADAYNNRANAYARLGDDRRAMEDFAKALDLNPRYAAAYNNRAAVYWALGERGKAVADLKSAARLGYEPARKALKSQGIGWE